jgi:hypothetical protein
MACANPARSLHFDMVINHRADRVRPPISGVTLAAMVALVSLGACGGGGGASSDPDPGSPGSPAITFEQIARTCPIVNELASRNDNWTTCLANYRFSGRDTATGQACVISVAADGTPTLTVAGQVVSAPPARTDWKREDPQFPDNAPAGTSRQNNSQGGTYTFQFGSTPSERFLSTFSSSTRLERVTVASPRAASVTFEGHAYDFTLLRFRSSPDETALNEDVISVRYSKTVDNVSVVPATTYRCVLEPIN